MKKVECDLNSCFLCSNCIPEWKDAIAFRKKTIAFRKGELVFKEGDKVNGIYFISAGAVKVHKHWADQKELIIRFSGAGDILGHRGLGGGELFPVSATALTESKICFIPNDFLEATLRVDHAFTYRLMQFYSAELQKAELRMRNLALMEVKARISETLLELLDVFGKNKDHQISVPVTRQDIASYAGVTYETVFKFLRSLVSSRVIIVSGKSIRINNENKLRNIVNNAPN